MAYNQPRTLVFLATGTANNTATFLQFTSLITSSFTTYYVSIRDLIPATDNVNLALTFSADNGSTYLATNYGYSHWDQTSGAAGSGINSASATSILLAAQLSNVSSRGFCADFQLVNMNTGSISPNLWGWGCHYNRSAVFISSMLSGYNSGTTAITAIKLESSSGNLTSGSITLYGVVE